MSVAKLMGRLDLNRESVLLVRNNTLVPGDAMLDDADVVEIRPVISGGSV
jgi:sulfur carrier protein